jgi:hypothetical protein
MTNVFFPQPVKTGNANREIGVPGSENVDRAAGQFEAGGGVTTAVILRIMPSDLLNT